MVQKNKQAVCPLSSISKKQNKKSVWKKGYCYDCKAIESPMWRSGPRGKKTLCNRCGTRYHRSNKEKERSNEIDMQDDLSGNAQLSIQPKQGNQNIYRCQQDQLDHLPCTNAPNYSLQFLDYKKNDCNRNKFLDNSNQIADFKFPNTLTFADDSIPKIKTLNSNQYNYVNRPLRNYSGSLLMNANNNNLGPINEVTSAQKKTSNQKFTSMYDSIKQNSVQGNIQKYLFPGDKSGDYTNKFSQCSQVLQQKKQVSRCQVQQKNTSLTQSLLEDQRTYKQLKSIDEQLPTKWETTGITIQKQTVSRSNQKENLLDFPSQYKKRPGTQRRLLLKPVKIQEMEIPDKSKTERMIQELVNNQSYSQFAQYGNSYAIFEKMQESQSNTEEKSNRRNIRTCVDNVVLVNNSMANQPSLKFEIGKKGPGRRKGSKIIRSSHKIGTAVDKNKLSIQDLDFGKFSNNSIANCEQKENKQEDGMRYKRQRDKSGKYQEALLSIKRVKNPNNDIEQTPKKRGRKPGIQSALKSLDMDMVTPFSSNRKGRKRVSFADEKTAMQNDRFQRLQLMVNSRPLENDFSLTENLDTQTQQRDLQSDFMKKTDQLINEQWNYITQLQDDIKALRQQSYNQGQPDQLLIVASKLQIITALLHEAYKYLHPANIAQAVYNGTDPLHYNPLNAFGQFTPEEQQQRKLDMMQQLCSTEAINPSICALLEVYNNPVYRIGQGALINSSQEKGGSQLLDGTACQGKEQEGNEENLGDSLQVNQEQKKTNHEEEKADLDESQLLCQQREQGIELIPGALDFEECCKENVDQQQCQLTDFEWDQIRKLQASPKKLQASQVDCDNINLPLK